MNWALMINLYLNITQPSLDSWAQPIRSATGADQQQNMLIILNGESRLHLTTLLALLDEMHSQQSSCEVQFNNPSIIVTLKDWIGSH